MRDWPTAKSQMSIISCTSPSPSARILPDLERNEFAEIVLLLAQSVAELADGFAAHRAGRDAPFHESFLRAADHLFVILRRGGAEFA